MKRVLDVGNCGPDHGALVDLLTANFQVEVVQAHGQQDALEQLQDQAFDLVTINRLMDRDGASGLAIVSAIKTTPELATTPVMLISNYQEYQQQALDAGAEMGFGKAALRNSETLERLREYLA